MNKTGDKLFHFRASLKVEELMPSPWGAARVQPGDNGGREIAKRQSYAPLF